ncbi:MAG TPA: hypothetical protein VK699_03440 [Terriglobales bacterium]|nr:hypothetical protein [Terriglobales bacterium]
MKIIAFVALLGKYSLILPATFMFANKTQPDEKPPLQQVEIKWEPYPGSVQISHLIQPAGQFFMPVGAVVDGRLIRGVMNGGGAVEQDVYKNPDGVTGVDIWNKYKTNLEAAHFRILTDCQGKECKLKDASVGLDLPIKMNSYYIAAEKSLGNNFWLSVAIHITSSNTYIVESKGNLGGHIVDTSFNSYDLIQTLMDLSILLLLIVSAIYRARWVFPAIILPFLSLLAFWTGEWALTQEHLVAPIRIDLFFVIPLLTAIFVLSIFKQIQQIRFQKRKLQS